MRKSEAKLLENIRVLDLADETGGYCGRILADLGADVIKVETSSGDPSRKKGPFLGTGAGGKPVSLSFVHNNLNKRSVALDAGTGHGIRSFRKLAETADVLVETASPGNTQESNPALAEIRRTNPGLICLSITPFGDSGPKRKWKASATTAAAAGGQMNVCRDAAGRPVKLHGLQAYYTASLYGAVAVLLHVVKRRITGAGSRIDLSIQEAVASTLDHVMVDHFSEGNIQNRREPSSHDRNFPVLPCKDGFIQITILQNWETLIEIMAAENRAAELQEARWKGQEFRENNFNHIVEVVKGWTAIHTRQELFELGQSMRFPWAPVAAAAEVPGSPQLQSRRFFDVVPVTAKGPEIAAAGSPYTFNPLSSPQPKPPPETGEHTDRILGELAAERAHGPNTRVRLNTGKGCPEDTILHGIRVLDLTRMLSGPYCTRILADFGAEVVKVQTGKTARGAERNGSPYFSAWNRNKRSVTLDLDRTEARECFLKLMAASGIVIENYSPRVMENWGLTYDRLKEENPSLIMLSLSAMGRSGPWKDYIGFGPTFHALSGLMAASSGKEDYPVTIGHAYGDIVIGLYAAVAILAALEFRNRTGEGLHIDLSGYEALCTMLGPALMRPGPSVPASEAHDGAFPDRSYPCKGIDRWCALTISGDEEWDTFRRITNDPGLESARFDTEAGRKENRGELDARISRWTSARTAESVVDTLQQSGIASSVVQDAEDLARDAQLAARNFFLSLKHPLFGATTADRSALWPWDKIPASWRAAPALGEANHDIFVGLLGMPEETFRSFIERGIIG